MTETAPCAGTHPGTAVFIVRPDDRFLLVRRAGDRPGAGEWSVPGGRVERGETWDDCARREAIEEVNIGLDTVHLLTITTAVGLTQGWLTVWGTSFRSTAPPAVMLNDEADDYEWVTCGELWKYPLWKAHWVPLLDTCGGTSKLEEKVKETKWVS